MTATPFSGGHSRPSPKLLPPNQEALHHRSFLNPRGTKTERAHHHLLPHLKNNLLQRLDQSLRCPCSQGRPH